MMELRFNDEFNGIIEVPINCWKTFDDIPQKIKDFITETSNSIPIFDESNNKYYCPKCVKEINEKKSWNYFNICSISLILRMAIYYFTYYVNI